ncbi:RNA-binding protein 48-like [Oncorhynchus kisutch]|uniref:RNA-binding protein 48-like n=1 Tax=Oncorhynchus kisutch TaxID=8019 RepID=UPI0009A089E2|nr:RNA-binding protein 48-like [Oncorhynchus kisutch]
MSNTICAPREQIIENEGDLKKLRFVEKGWMNTLQRNSEVYLIKFQKLTSARQPKGTWMRRVSLEVYYMCYAPEYETVENTRLKLQDGRYVNRTAQNKEQDQGDEEEKAHVFRYICYHSQDFLR